MILQQFGERANVFRHLFFGVVCLSSSNSSLCNPFMTQFNACDILDSLLRFGGHRHKEMLSHVHS